MMSTSIHAPELIERHPAASLDPRHSVHALLREARHLHELERAGESEWTPFLAILGLVLFLGVLFLFMLSLAEAAYYVIA
jgi:hypothetical protein